MLMISEIVAGRSCGGRSAADYLILVRISLRLIIYALQFIRPIWPNVIEKMTKRSSATDFINRADFQPRAIPMKEKSGRQIVACKDCKCPYESVRQLF